MSADGPIRLTICAEDAGATILRIAGAALGSLVAAERVLAHGGLWHNRARVADGAQTVTLGDTVFIHRPSDGVYVDVSLDPARVLYEDDALIAVDKPLGVYVESTPWDTGGHLRGAVERFLKERLATTEASERVEVSGNDDHIELLQPPFTSVPSVPSVAKIHLVHRLDRDTSGVLLLSKDPAVNPALQRAFVGGQVHKEYRCLCAGEPLEDTFMVTSGHGRARQGLWRVYPAEEIGRELPNGSRVKSMVTRFRVERRLGDATLLLAFPETGRTHQIRLHLAHLGHPLLGDTRYGGPDMWREQPLLYHLLHAARLELPHPRSGEPLVIVAPLPAWAELTEHEGTGCP